MPEGDTIHTLARTLRAELTGQVLVGGRVRGREHERLDGRAVLDVRARGKHLFVHLGRRAADDGPLTIRSHLGLHGSWHRYRPGEPWNADRGRGRRTGSTPSILLETRRRVYVCFRAAELAVLDGEGASFDFARALGPDLVERAPEAHELVPRVHRFAAADAPLVDVLLDQRIASGIGNVHACEALFAEGLHPLEPVGTIGSAALAALFVRAHEHLVANVGPGPRTTRARDGRDRHAVYGRAGRPCFVCATPIQAQRLGRGHRITSWCPSCQVHGSPARGTIAPS